MSNAIENQAIVGTAGHIDHGKSALVHALTGVEMDSLPEEQSRGISIELGFAPLELEDGALFGFVDVPGHERFVKTMVAGASGFAHVILVVAADQGIQPQTIEHLRICELLGVPSGLIALTRVDLLEESSRKSLVAKQMKDIEALVQGGFLEGAPVICCSSTTGEGLDEIKTQLQKLAPPKGLNSIRKRPFRMYVDRVFAKQGFGTVVTGSGYRGTVKPGDKLMLYPEKLETNVRKVESFMQPLKYGNSGMRLALNLQHADVDDTERGVCLAAEDHVQPSQQVIVDLSLLDNAMALKHNSWVRLHWGTSESRARVLFRGFYKESPELASGSRTFALLKLEEPIFVKMGDRLILRSQTPVTTIGGAKVLVPTSDRFRFSGNRWSAEELEVFRQQLDTGECWPEVLLLALKRSGMHGCTLEDLGNFFDRSPKKITLELEEELLQQRVIAAWEKVEGELRFDIPLVLESEFCKLCEKFLLELQQHALKHVDDPVINQESLRMKLGQKLLPAVFKRALARLKVDKRIEVTKDGGVKLAGVKAAAKNRTATKAATAEKPTSQVGFADQLVALVAKAGITPPNIGELGVLLGAPPLKIDGFLKALLREGTLIKLPGEFFVDPKVLESLKGELLHYFSEHEQMTIVDFKGITKTSRKYTVPILEYFDQKKFTLRRQDDTRVLGPKLKELL